MKSYWYFKYWFECPCCGDIIKIDRERRYAKKPKFDCQRRGTIYRSCPSCSEDLTPVELMEMEK